MDKQKYYVNERVKLKICVKNRSAGYNSFIVFEKNRSGKPDYTTFQPVVYDMAGHEAEIIIPYRLKNQDFSSIIKEMNKRVIELAPEETIIHSIDLRNIYNLKINKKYRVKGYFFTDFSKKLIIQSNNILTFKIIKEIKIPDKKIESIERGVTAPEVIMLSLNAEKSKKWDRMLKYFNIEKYISSYSNYVRLYNRSDVVGKRKVLDRFKTFLSRDRHDHILNFKVIKDEIEDNGYISYINVVVDRAAPKVTDRYLYRYTLEKYKNLWLIVNLEATVMKGVKR